MARKFAARHRTAVAAGITAVVLLVTGGAALVHSTRVAQIERAKAQQRFEQVRDLANSLVFELHDGIAALPGATAVRKRLVSRALQHLDSLDKMSSGNPDLQLNIAQSYERLGSVQGHISEMNLGDPQGALTSYKRAIEVLSGVPAAVRERTDILRELGYLHLLRGDVFRDLRRTRDRDDEYGQGLAIIGQLGARFPDDEAILNLYSTALFGIAKGRSAEDPDAARQLFLRCLDLDQKLLAAHPGDWKYPRSVALDHKFLSSVLPSHQEALDHLGQARVLDEQRVAARPDDAQAKLDLSFDLSEMAAHLEATGDLDRALELSLQVQSIRNQLAAADPNDAQIRLRVMTAGRATASVLAKMNRLDDAVREYQVAAARAESARSAVPADPRNRGILGELQLGIASTEQKIAAQLVGTSEAASHLRKSCAEYSRAAKTFESLVAEGIATREESNAATAAARAAAGCQVSTP